MKDFFKSKQLQKEFISNGYVEIPLLDDDDIFMLLNLFSQNNQQYNQPFHTSHFSTDIDYKRSVNDAIINVVSPKLMPVLQGYRAIFGNLMVKQVNSDYFMPLHADWTYVDENKSRSAAIWIPLVDTNEENGCLGVIAASHRVMSKIRGPGIQVSSSNNNEEWIRKFGKLLPTKSGHAIIYDHALMHYSPPNKSKSMRPALNLSIVPEDADIFHYCIPQGANEIEVYKVNDSEFYLRYNNYQRPETNSLIKTLKPDLIEWVDSKMETFNQTKKDHFLSRVFEFLK